MTAKRRAAERASIEGMRRMRARTRQGQAAQLPALSASGEATDREAVGLVPGRSVAPVDRDSSSPDASLATSP